ncbi:MAG: nucleoside monophosphate kinase, partial [Verrucomicrobia bacterium]|nr:nucleoside monophosphate kinase [Verrucomicrobiota bacterium]
MKRRVVLLGPPASGKGTQAELIRVRYKIPTTSTGAILRQ